MPPNPRDNLSVGQDVPLDRLRQLTAAWLAAWRDESNDPIPLRVRRELAELVVERYSYFQLLAHDVEPLYCVPSRGVHVRVHGGMCMLR